MMLEENSAIYSVSRLNQQVKQLLEQQIGQIWLVGEISNFSQPVSGHWYFTLKDAHAQVRCAMFRHVNRTVSFQPKNGQQVLLRASLTLYEARGEYQLVAQSLQLSGDGLLQQQFDQLKNKLFAEGLFDGQFKKNLPSPATCIGIITSSTGAALHDILHVLKRRDPSLPVIIYPSAVQGDDAPQQIVTAIETANHRAECDVLIIGRGGGSLEDLWAFNNEKVARAIFNSVIPVVSAVGHEVDFTIADFVADVRAPTPSAAAEIVSRNQQELLRQLTSYVQHICMAMDYYFAHKKALLSKSTHRLQQQHPQLRLARQNTDLIQQKNRLQQAMRYYLQQQYHQQQKLQTRLLELSPQKSIHVLHNKIQHSYYQLQQHIQHQLQQAKQRLAVCASHLEGVSPLATLARGYSISIDSQQNTIKSIEQLAVNNMLSTTFSDGTVKSRIETITKKNII